MFFDFIFNLLSSRMQPINARSQKNNLKSSNSFGKVILKTNIGCIGLRLSVGSETQEKA